MYELLVIISGESTAEETVAKLAEVQTKLAEAGATVEETITIGKHKIAYPIQHIRHGYFYAFYFSIDPTKLGTLRFEMERHMGLLRVFVRQFNPALDKKVRVETFTTEVMARRDRDGAGAGGMHRAPMVMTAPVSATEELMPATALPERVLEPAAAEYTPVKEEKKPIDIEAIDKKLDEILESDMMGGEA